MNCPCHQAIHAQGKGECACSRDASRRAMKSPLVISIAAAFAVIALGKAVERLFGTSPFWPF
jgi:hypothetical protein